MKKTLWRHYSADLSLPVTLRLKKNAVRNLREKT